MDQDLYPSGFLGECTFTLFDTHPQTHNPSKYVRTGQSQRSRSPEVKVSKGQGLCQSFQVNTDTGDSYRDNGSMVSLEVTTDNSDNGSMVPFFVDTDHVFYYR